MAEFITDLIAYLIVELVPMRWLLGILAAIVVLVAVAYFTPRAEVPPAPSGSSSLGNF